MLIIYSITKDSGEKCNTLKCQIRLGKHTKYQEYEYCKFSLIHEHIVGVYNVCILKFIIYIIIGTKLKKVLAGTCNRSFGTRIFRLI